jgi:hypothetical protein
MKKQTLTLIELGIVFLTAAIVLDYVLGGYQILLWPSLAFEFALLGVMIFSSLWEHTPQTSGRGQKIIRQNETELTRLEHICKAAILQGDETAQNLLSERVRSLALAAARSRLSTPQTTLTGIAREEPELLQSRTEEPDFLRALGTNGNMIQRGNSQVLERLLEKIEEWTK